MPAAIFILLAVLEKVRGGAISVSGGGPQVNYPEKCLRVDRAFGHRREPSGRLRSHHSLLNLRQEAAEASVTLKCHLSGLIMHRYDPKRHVPHIMIGSRIFHFALSSLKLKAAADHIKRLVRCLFSAPQEWMLLNT